MSHDGGLDCAGVIFPLQEFHPMQVALRATLALVLLAASSGCSAKPAAPPEQAVRSDSSAAAVPSGGTPAAAASAPADAKEYGKPLTLKQTTLVSEILKNPGTFEG